MTEIDVARLGRIVASHVIDALNAAGFADELATRIAAQMRYDLDKAAVILDRLRQVSEPEDHPLGEGRHAGSGSEFYDRDDEPEGGAA